MHTQLVPVCRANNTTVFTQGEVYGIWSVAPTLFNNAKFTAGAWSVRSAENGMTVACFTEKHVAVNFAKMLIREYGDISQTLRNSYNNAETPEDARLLDEINQRSNHPARIRKGMVIKYIPVPMNIN
jgi:hypothetical protein